ncbi:MAG: tRNA (cytidine(34)-2'-O)-methyltransferase [Epsilonproteobacteria bacterium]|nr:tRNA (cytidine(34)-2'-O)-methyltransferase [Campylobacterota bacterium]NPA57198.1 tRNA (cytidine(34)-2'-O)-methyltransferase [Campylobacterota bacterium]
MFHIVLVHPQIPPNTGNIGRLCINTGATLHLISPLGFDVDDRALKRAGLDYWKRLNPTIWESLHHFLDSVDPQRLWLASTKGVRSHFKGSYRVGDYLLFGSETAGLPDWLLERYRERSVRIPICPEGRSLNLAVSVGILLYEAIRQNREAFCERDI